MRTVTYGGAVSLDRISRGCGRRHRLAALQQGRAAGDGGVLEGGRRHSHGAEDLRRHGGATAPSARRGDRRSRRRATNEEPQEARSQDAHLCLLTYPESHRQARRGAGERRRGGVRARSQAASRRAHLPDGRRRAGAIADCAKTSSTRSDSTSIRSCSALGVPVFRDPGHRVAFTLTECRQIDGGCVVVKYTLARK